MGDSTKGRSGTFSSQASLPALPVPDLEETIERLLEWASPLLDPDTLERTGRSAREFASESGPGPILQKALKEFAARKDVANWLESFWEWMYLSGRASLPFYSNIFYMFSPRSASPKDLTLAGHAAGLVVSALRFKKLVDTGQLPPDTEKGRPICMIQYKKMFSSARIPEKGMDRIRNPVISHDPTEPYERHIVVISGGRFFSVDVIDHEGNFFDVVAVESAIQEIMDLEGEATSPAGVLTTLPRDDWAEARANLSIISDNRKILDTIERALFILCLEQRQPEGIKQLSKTMLTGDGRSRWFDKGMQFIVCPDGTSAINMEHTATDGSIMVRFASFVGNDDPWNGEGSIKNGKCSWRDLVFDIDDDMASIIESAATGFDRMKSDTETEVLIFGSFGKERIKGLSVAPDAFVQMAMQLAQQDVWGVPRSTYEAVMTRQFLHGRTEAVRSVSEESVIFTRVMRDPSATDSEKAVAIRAAAEKHVSRMKESKAGKGVERHLLGLRRIYETMGKDLGLQGEPEFFSDRGLKTLTRTLLSTSTSAVDGMYLAGFGTVDDEGLGVRYLTFPGSIHFNITSRTALRGQLELFAQSLDTALREMAETIDRAKQ